MALKFDKQLENGLVMRYHRISSLNVIVNQSILVQVESYSEQSTRELQSERAADENINTAPVFSSCENYLMDYQDGVTAKDAYEWLKTLEEFDGSEDV